MPIVFYISGHGFGHATRDLEVIKEIRARNPHTPVVIRSAVASTFLEQETDGSVELEFCETDTGVTQVDSLRPDPLETARRAALFYREFDARVAAEAEALRRMRADVVVGDVPPLAFAAAASAGVPSIALANFTWDWIYEGYATFAAVAPGVIEKIRSAYAKASMALRLPFAGGFAPMHAVTRDIPLVARTSRLSRDAARTALELDARKPIVLASFGGYGVALPFFEIARTNDVTLVVTDHEAPASTDEVRCFTREALTARNLRYADLVAAADVVVTKPGYGIVSECIANGASLLYTSRGPFAEEEVLVSGMKPFLRCGFISPDDLRAGRWQQAIEELLRQPGPVQQINVGGARVAAEAIVKTAEDYARGRL